MPGLPNRRFPDISCHGFVTVTGILYVETGGVFGCIDRPVEIGETGTPIATACPCEREQQQQDQFLHSSYYFLYTKIRGKGYYDKMYLLNRLHSFLIDKQHRDGTFPIVTYRSPYHLLCRCRDEEQHIPWRQLRAAVRHHISLVTLYKHHQFPFRQGQIPDMASL